MNMVLELTRLKEIAKNISYMFLLQAFNFILPFYAYYSVSKNLGELDLARFFYFIAFVAVGVVLSDLGMSIYSLLKFGRVKNKKNYIFSFFALKCLALTFISLVFFLLSEYMSFSIQETFSIVVVLICQSLQPVWLFQFYEKIYVNVLSGVIGKSLSLLIIFILASQDSNLNFYFISFAFGALVSLLMAMYFMFKFGYFNLILALNGKSLLFTLALLKSSFSTFMSRIYLIFYTSFTPFIYGSFHGLQSVASFGMAERIYNAGQGVITPISQVLYPFMVNRPNLKTFILTIAAFFIIFVSGVLGIYSFSDVLLGELYGEYTALSVEFLNIFLLISCVNCLSIFFGYPAYALIGSVELVNKSVKYGLVVYIVAIPIFIYFLEVGERSIVFSLLCSEFFVLCFRCMNFFKRVKVR